MSENQLHLLSVRHRRYGIHRVESLKNIEEGRRWISPTVGYS